MSKKWVRIIAACVALLLALVMLLSLILPYIELGV